MHVLTAALDSERNAYGTFMREQPTVEWSQVAKSHLLMPTIEAALGLLFQPDRPNNPSPRWVFHGHDFTFSERPAEVAKESLAETPEELAGVDLGLMLDILVPRNAFAADDRWALIARIPQAHGSPISTRLSGRGVACTTLGLRDWLTEWFNDGTEHRTTFGPPNRFVSRPPDLRELRVRPAWSAPAILPEDFPPPKPLPPRDENQTERWRQMLSIEQAQEKAKRETAAAEAHKREQERWLRNRLRSE